MRSERQSTLLKSRLRKHRQRLGACGSVLSAMRQGWSLLAALRVRSQLVTGLLQTQWRYWLLDLCANVLRGSGRLRLSLGPSGCWRGCCAHSALPPTCTVLLGGG